MSCDHRLLNISVYVEAHVVSTVLQQGRLTEQMTSEQLKVEQRLSALLHDEKASLTPELWSAVWVSVPATRIVSGRGLILHAFHLLHVLPLDLSSFGCNTSKRASLKFCAERVSLDFYFRRQWKKSLLPLLKLLNHYRSSWWANCLNGSFNFGFLWTKKTVLVSHMWTCMQCAQKLMRKRLAVRETEVGLTKRAKDTRAKHASTTPYFFNSLKQCDVYLCPLLRCLA